MNKVKVVKVDIFIKDSDGTVYFFDIKTVKPNISNFKDFKRTLLEWTAIYLAKQPKAIINTFIAIPYNPYEPKPYQRWTLKGMLDIDRDLKIAEEFWDFIGGKNTYSILLDCFETAGIELSRILDAYFEKFK